jgi:hypothetical protein
MPQNNNEKKQPTDEQILSSQYKETFSTTNGKEVLLHILNELGYFTTDPNRIIAENIAIANKIVLTIGATHEDNILSFVSGLVGCKSIEEN